MKIFIIPIIAITITACTGSKKELSEHEKLYAEVADSLVKYKKEIPYELKKQKFSDFIKLDYKTFKTKYDLSEEEMKILIDSYIVSYKIAQTTREIEKNMLEFKKSSGLLERSEPGDYDYSFNKEDTSLFPPGKDVEVQVLMEAYDSDGKLIKKGKKN